MLVEKKGGQCILCGYRKSVEALDFHHIDRSTKTFGISLNVLTRSWESIQKEAEKCILVCANCHREIHANLVQLPRAIAVEKRGELSPSAQKRAKGIRSHHQ